MHRHVMALRQRPIGSFPREPYPCKRGFPRGAAGASCKETSVSGKSNDLHAFNRSTAVPRRAGERSYARH